MLVFPVRARRRVTTAGVALAAAFATSVLGAVAPVGAATVQASGPSTAAETPDCPSGVVHGLLATHSVEACLNASAPADSSRPRAATWHATDRGSQIRWTPPSYNNTGEKVVAYLVELSPSSRLRVGRAAAFPVVRRTIFDAGFPRVAAIYRDNVSQAERTTESQVAKRIDAPITWIGMGDSYAAGDAATGPYNGPAGGVAAYTDRGCSRSNGAWAPQLVDRLGGAAFFDFTHIACAGDTGVGLVQQITALRTFVDSASIDIITMSVGGNDVGFSDYADECARIAWNSERGRCDVRSPAPDSLGVAGADERVEALVRATRNAAPRAQVLVATYPELFAPSDRITGAYRLGSGLSFSPATAKYISTTLQPSLNAAVVRGAKAAGASVVDMGPATTDRWLNVRDQFYAGSGWIKPVTLAATPGFVSVESLHPTLPGQNAMTDLAAAELDTPNGAASSQPVSLNADILAADGRATTTPYPDETSIEVEFRVDPTFAPAVNPEGSVGVFRQRSGGWELVDALTPSGQRGDSWLKDRSTLPRGTYALKAFNPTLGLGTDQQFRVPSAPVVLRDNVAFVEMDASADGRSLAVVSGTPNTAQPQSVQVLRDGALTQVSPSYSELNPPPPGLYYMDVQISGDGSAVSWMSSYIKAGRRVFETYLSRAGAAPELLCTDCNISMSRTADTIAISTAEQLSPADTDADYDIYSVTGDIVRLLSDVPDQLSGGYCLDPDVSRNGQWVAFDCNKIPRSNGDIFNAAYRYPLNGSAPENISKLTDDSAGGQADRPVIADNGSVAFYRWGTDPYFFDAATRLTIKLPDTGNDTTFEMIAYGSELEISADARYVSFLSTLYYKSPRASDAVIWDNKLGLLRVATLPIGDQGLYVQRQAATDDGSILFLGTGRTSTSLWWWKNPAAN